MINIRTGASAAVVAALGASTALAATTYAATNSSSVATTTTVTKYTTGTTNVRTAATTSSSIAGKLAMGTKITGSAQSNGWIKIATPTNFAGKYVSGAVLSSMAPAVPKPAPTSGMVTGWVRGDDLTRYKVAVEANVRSAPSVSAPIVGQVAAASKVTGELKDGWVHTPTGYINAAVLEFASSDIFVSNARMPASDLCAIPKKFNSSNTFAVRSRATRIWYAYDSSTQRYLHCAALSSLVALEEAYRKASGHYAPIDMGYRAWDEQRAWAEDSRYHGSPAGRSNHGWGLAVDFSDDDSAHDGHNEFADHGAGYAWLTKNAASFGYAVDPVVNAPVATRPSYWPSETFHWNFVG